MQFIYHSRILHLKHSFKMDDFKYKVPKATTGVVIYELNGNQIKVLMTKRNIEPFKDHWCLPGGHVEPYEEISRAAIREAKEETNMDFYPEGFLGYFEEIFPEIRLHNVALFFYGQAKGEPIKEIKEVTEIAWFDITEALKLKLAFTHDRVLESFREKMSKPTTGNKAGKEK